jgi:hypothetical protein
VVGSPQWLATALDTDGDGTANLCDACAGGAASGDPDADGVLSLIDYTMVPDCLGGPGIIAPDGCECFDFDSDNDNDLKDFAAFQSAFNGG